MKRSSKVQFLRFEAVTLREEKVTDHLDNVHGISFYLHWPKSLKK